MVKGSRNGGGEKVVMVLWWGMEGSTKKGRILGEMRGREDMG